MRKRLLTLAAQTMARKQPNSGYEVCLRCTSISAPSCNNTAQRTCERKKSKAGPSLGSHVVAACNLFLKSFLCWAVGSNPTGGCFARTRRTASRQAGWSTVGILFEAACLLSFACGTASATGPVSWVSIVSMWLPTTSQKKLQRAHPRKQVLMRKLVACAFRFPGEVNFLTMSFSPTFCFKGNSQSRA